MFVIVVGLKSSLYLAPKGTPSF